MIIFGDDRSGNCLKLKYAADYLGLDYEWRHVDIMAGEARTPEFLDINPMGQVPALLCDDGRPLAQSNAILRYLARESALIPADAYRQAQMDAWLFWEQYSHEPYVAVCRFQHVYLGRARDEIEEWRWERGNGALDLMERHLAGHDWFVDGGFSIADIALLAYSRVADQGYFDLSSRPALTQWIARCEKLLKLR
jgi:glutathione S-transferase